MQRGKGGTFQRIRATRTFSETCFCSSSMKASRFLRSLRLRSWRSFSFSSAAFFSRCLRSIHVLSTLYSTLSDLSIFEHVQGQDMLLQQLHKGIQFLHPMRLPPWRFFLVTLSSSAAFFSRCLRTPHAPSDACGSQDMQMLPHGAVLYWQHLLLADVSSKTRVAQRVS